MKSIHQKGEVSGFNSLQDLVIIAHIKTQGRENKVKMGFRYVLKIKEFAVFTQ